MTDLLAGLRVDDVNRPLERLPVSTAGLSARIRVVLHPDERKPAFVGYAYELAIAVERIGVRDDCDPDVDGHLAVSRAVRSCGPRTR